MNSPASMRFRRLGELLAVAGLLEGCSTNARTFGRRGPDGGILVDGGGTGGTSGTGATSGTGGHAGQSTSGSGGAAGHGAGASAGAIGHPESGGSGLDAMVGGGGAPDASPPDDGGPACVPETDPAFCLRLHSTCGDVSATDNCKAARSANCGKCASTDTCGAGNTCVAPNCVPETNPAYCARLGRDCGVFSGYDNCGVGRSSNCGNCTQPKVCGTDNTCACVTESDATFCSRLGKNCDSVTAPNNCGASHTANCGTCTSPKTCGATNVCACVAETGPAFCARLGKDCGSVTAPDTCGTSRTFNCGTCAGTDACGNKNVCVMPLACTGRNDPVSITFFDLTGSTVPTPVGGVLVDGYYLSTKISSYGSVSSGIGGSLEIRSGFIRRVHTTYNTQGSALTGWTEQGTYTNPGTSIVDTVTNCNYGGTGTQTLLYTASSTQIRLFETISGATVVTQYEVQP